MVILFYFMMVIPFFLYFQVDPLDFYFTGNDVCPVGYFCPNGTGYPLPCPVGTYSEVEELTQEEDCLPCPPGRWCNTTAYDHATGPLCAAG